MNEIVVLFTFPELCVSQIHVASFVKCISLGAIAPGVAMGAGLSGRKNLRSVSCHFLQVKLP